MTTPKALAAADLARSGIPPSAASAAGIGVVPDARALHHEYASAPALVIPYVDPWTGDAVRYPNGGGAPLPFARIRYLDGAPTRPAVNPFKPAKVQRYAQPSGSGVHAYFPPVVGLSWADVASDPEHPVLIVEGEKKAFAATLHGFACVGLGGVHNFYSSGVFLAELERFEWKGRPTYICFDSDAAHNPQIQAAEARLAAELSLHRGAALYLVRLPNLSSGDKQGVDDFLLREGPDKLDALLQSAPRLRKIDAEVVSLNQHVAWIEKEGCVYDLRSKEFIQKANFTNGSAYSAREVMAPTDKGTGVKRISVTESWLRHPHAQRYDYVEFSPESTNPVLHTEAGGLALNMWTGWSPEPGDVAPFLDLTTFLFRDLEEHADLPLRLLAYKAQNPGSKVPLALVLVGQQGCISADARIPFHTVRSGRVVNTKGGALETLYRRFHSLPQRTGGPRQSNEGTDFYVRSVNDEYVVFMNRVTNVVDSGRKQVFRIETQRGNTLKATSDHKILTPDGYVELRNLHEGAAIYAYGGVQSRRRGRTLSNRPEIFVKHHPYARKKVVDGRYEYRRLTRYRAVYEAHMNGLTVGEYAARLNAGNLEGLRFLPPGVEIHHRDENPHNNAIENLVAVDPGEHKRLHWSANQRKSVAVEDTILSITPLGVEQVYDIVVEDPYRNFIADGVVVHNCGKSLWAECARDAFAPYTAEVPSSALGSQFNGWTERTLLAVINEASAETLQRYAPALRALISDKRVMLNEKFRVARQIDSFTQYIITSNDRGAGAYSADDRRMIVVSCPRKREPSFYSRVAAWKRAGGGSALLHHLLTLDLQGWEPPQQAPLTAEKYMAYMESLSPTQRLAEEMQTADENVIVMWIAQALSWAQSAEISNNVSASRYAREIMDSLATIQIRPWYTPEELGLMFPSIVSQLHGARGVKARVAGEISRELRTAGVGYLRCADDPRGFRWRGSIRQYLVVAEADEWTEPLPQAEFERLMAQFPRYGDLAKRRG